MTQYYPVVVVGMGPAGMAAAIELSRSGVTTALIDQAARPGGQVYRQPPPEFTWPAGDTGARRRIGRRLLQELRQCGSGLTLIQNAVVWGAFERGRLSVEQGGRLREIGYETLIICEGAQERIIPCPGWTLPGVLTLGAIQKMIVTQGIAPRGRVVLAGSGPLLVGTAAALVQAGVSRIDCYEAAPLLTWSGMGLAMYHWPRLIAESLEYFQKLFQGRVRLHLGWVLQGLEGGSQVRQAALARADRHGAAVPGSLRTVPANVVGIGFGLQPAVRLARLVGCRVVYDGAARAFAAVTNNWGQSSQPHIYVAGDGAQVGGADWSEIQGRLAGLHAARQHGRLTESQLLHASGPWRKQNQRLARYRTAYLEAFTPQDGHYHTITPDTVICRCEGVTAGTILSRIRLGQQDMTAFKIDRLGMGPCQARGCEGTVAELLRQRGTPADELRPLNLRPPLVPLPLSVFGNKNMT